ncbi:MFS transporter [soil metagenome]
MRAVARPAGGRVAPLYAAGFVTAFGAHSIAAGIGAESANIGLSLLSLGALLAVYDLAEVVLKPLFGSLSDRIGAKPVIIGGLLAFALVSASGIWAEGTLMLLLVRLGQGAAASAFSPASSAAVARLSAGGSAGSYFGRYGSWKGLGYAIGPLLGATLIWIGDFALLFGVLSLTAAVSAIWVALSMPRLEPLPRPRYTIIDLIRQTTTRSFLIPTLALAATTGALGAAVGFLPALGTTLHLNVFGSVGVVSLLAIASAVVQPVIGRLRDQRRIGDRTGITTGLLVAAAGAAIVALLPGPVALYFAAAALGAGIGIVTPLAFAHLAETTPVERMGRTMGTAELGRELGDAGGPLLVGAIAAATSLPLGLGALAAALVTVGFVSRGALQHPMSPTRSSPLRRSATR